MRELITGFLFTLSPGSFFSGVLGVSDDEGRAFGGLEQA